MTMPMTGARAASAVVLALCCACGDAEGPDGTGGAGQGGGGVGAGIGSGGGPFELDTLDEPCGPSGITGQGVLDAIEPEYQATLEGEVTAALTVRVAYAGGKLVCHPPYSTGETGPEVSELLDVDVDVDFETMGGAFAEHFSAPLSGNASGSPTLAHAMKEADIQGSYEPNLADLYDVGVSISATFDHAHTFGNVFKGGKKSETVGESHPVGSWDTQP